MKKNLIELLKCPNSRGEKFAVFAQKIFREEGNAYHVYDSDIRPTDEIETGVIIDNDAGEVYLISEYILIMLADEDSDTDFEIPLFETALAYVPDRFRLTIRSKIERLRLSSSTEVGNWNRDEMRYYDQAVDSPEKRAAFLKDIKSNPLWHISLERKAHLINKICVNPVSNVLEIGCGNARSVSWIYPPAEHKYNYVGTDISLQRLVLAKQVIPEGEFVQCSALNLPFQTDTFDLTFSFGMLHHLPDQPAAFCQVFSTLKQRGEFLVHEPVKKPKNILPESGRIYRLAKRAMTTYTHSDHDHDLNIEETLQTIDRLKGRVGYKHFTGSLVRTIGARLLAIIPRLHAKRLAWRVLIAVDHFFGRAFCRTPNRLGPHAVFMVIKKQ